MPLSLTYANAAQAQRPVISFEFFPPKSPEAEQQLRETINTLAPLKPDFVSITYGAGGTTRDRTIELTHQIQHETGIETVSHLTCVGHSRDELAGILQRLRQAGVRNILALRGDPPKGEGKFTPHPQGLAHSCELVEMVLSAGGFDVAVAGYPEGHLEAQSKHADVQYLKRKIDSGAHGVITQLFFNNAHYFGFVAWARSIGVPAHIPIIPGIMPVTNVKQIKRFTNMCGSSLPGDLLARLEEVQEDDAAVARVGIEHAKAQCRELIEHGAPGIHFYTLNRSTATREIFESLGLPRA